MKNTSVTLGVITIFKIKIAKGLSNFAIFIGKMIGERLTINQTLKIMHSLFALAIFLLSIEINLFATVLCLAYFLVTLCSCKRVGLNMENEEDI